ncbi:hypothetical protein B296_00000084 [Ensete ventricosum]|uniref:Uncharacterized protein n=1 Tax=Ensete ventricosum TaxID=4639 RepID=A0A427AZW4_ENSVE|nr:hypothetical protein B296_00000084 [Ensete ventricosum]
MASNLASISSSDDMAYNSKSVMLRFFFCCRVKGMYWLKDLVFESDGGPKVEGCEVVAVFLLAGDADNKEGKRVPVSNRVRRGRGSGSSRVRRGVAAVAGDNWARLRQRWLQREEDEEGAAGGDYGSKGGWLQPSPSVARWGGKMGDGDVVEGWKAAAAREEKEAAGVRQGLRQWMAGVAGQRWREQQQRCWICRKVGSARAGSRGGDGLRGEDEEDNNNKGREGGRGQRWVAAVAGDRSWRVWSVVG